MGYLETLDGGNGSLVMVPVASHRGGNLLFFPGDLFSSFASEDGQILVKTCMG
jgi:hypothetical protein